MKTLLDFLWLINVYQPAFVKSVSSSCRFVLQVIGICSVFSFEHSNENNNKS